MDMRPQEVAWTEPLDEDELHTSYVPDQVAPTLPPPRRLHSCWRRSGLRTVDDPHRSTRGGGPSTWPRTCSPDYRPIRRPTISSCATPWTPRKSPSGGGRATPATEKRRSTPTRIPHPTASRRRPCHRARRAWDATLGEYILDWDDVIASPDPHDFAVTFARSAFQHACVVCSWDPSLAASAEGSPPPVA